MKLFKIVLAVLVFLVNLVVAQPAWADTPKFTNSPDYTEVTQALDKLLNAQSAPDQSGYTPEEIQQKIGSLRLQKYILETAEDWGQCRNETGKMLGVYAHKPKKSRSSQESTLYFLADGETTDDDWNCDGIYLPSGVKVVGLSPADTQGKQLGEPVALKFVDGTQLVAKTNPQAGAVELNVSPAKVFKTGEVNWFIPNLSQEDIESKAPNAPISD